MTSPLLVGTRKGLFVMECGGDGAWTIARQEFLGVPVSAVAFDRRDGALYAALNHGHFGVKLHRSDDRGASWTELTAPSFPAGIEPDKEGGEAPSVNQLWVLEPAGPDAPGVLWAGTVPGGLFRSADRGADWDFVASLWQHEKRREWLGGGNDSPGIHSIVFDPHDSHRLVLGVSTGGVWLSDDDGATWRLGGKGLIATYMPEQRRLDPAIQDVHRLARCAAAPERIWAQHHNGVFRSDDGGETWQQITGLPLSDFGFAVAVHPHAPDTAWFVPAVRDEIRVPVNGHFAVTCTRDGGKSFTLHDAGLPPPPAFDLVWRHALDVTEDGTTLAMGSTTGGLWISSDGGRAWRLASAHPPPIACVRFAA